MTTNKYRKFGYDGWLHCSIHKLIPIRIHTFLTLPKWKQEAILRKWHGEPKKYIAIRYFKCKAFDINTPEKLAIQIRMLCGFGHFMFGINGLHYSKTYSDKFVCPKSECSFYSTCNISPRHKQGWSCRMNLKRRKQFLRYCEIDIMPKRKEFNLIEESFNNVEDADVSYEDYYGDQEDDFYYNITSVGDKLILLKWFFRY